MENTNCGFISYFFSCESKDSHSLKRAINKFFIFWEEDKQILNHTPSFDDFAFYGYNNIHSLTINQDDGSEIEASFSFAFDNLPNEKTIKSEQKSRFSDLWERFEETSPTPELCIIQLTIPLSEELLRNISSLHYYQDGAYISNLIAHISGLIGQEGDFFQILLLHHIIEINNHNKYNYLIENTPSLSRNDPHYLKGNIPIVVSYNCSIALSNGNSQDSSVLRKCIAYYFLIEKIIDLYSRFLKMHRLKLNTTQFELIRFGGHFTLGAEGADLHSTEKIEKYAKGLETIKESMNNTSYFKSFIFQISSELNDIMNPSNVEWLYKIPIVLGEERKIQQKIKFLDDNIAHIFESYSEISNSKSQLKQQQMLASLEESSKSQQSILASLETSSNAQIDMAKNQAEVAESQATMTENSLQHQFLSTMLSNAFEMFEIIFAFVGMLQISIILYQSFLEENTPPHIYFALLCLLLSILLAIYTLEMRKQIILCEIAERRYKTHWIYLMQQRAQSKKSKFDYILTKDERIKLVEDTIVELEPYTILPRGLGRRFIRELIEPWGPIWVKKFELIDHMLVNGVTNVEQISTSVNSKMKEIYSTEEKKLRKLRWFGKGKKEIYSAEQKQFRKLRLFGKGNFDYGPAHVKCDEEDIAFIASYPINRERTYVGRDQPRVENIEDILKEL